MEPANDIKTVYYNKPQRNAILIDAPEGYHIWGRGTGKSSGLLAFVNRRNVIEMPRSKGLLAGETYQQILSRTLPSMINGWEKLGLIKDVHYVIGKKPLRKWKWPEPYEPPQSYDHFISVCNGSGIQLISQDIKGSSNGLNGDYFTADEAKYLDYSQFLDETLPTLRANRTRFGHLHFHCGITMTTSMPTAADAKWIIKKEEEVDQERLKLLKLVLLEIMAIQKQLALRPSNKRALLRLDKLNFEANILRKAVKDAKGRIIEPALVYFSEASSFENIDILGIEYIHRMRRNMPDFIFETEILNKRPDVIEGGFYPDLKSEDVKEGGHTYGRANDNSFLESLDYDLEKAQQIDSRKDSDVVKNAPLRIAVDWGDKINCLTVTQFHSNVLWFLNNLYVKHPEFLDHLAKKFVDYYAYHQCKEVVLIPDHTGHTGQANSNMTFVEQFAKIVRASGWTVNIENRRRAPSHQEKYFLNHKMLAEEDKSLPKIRINKRNCMELLNSMLQAPVKQGPAGIEKDKGSERKKNFPAEDATHFSDTFDIHVESLFSKYLKDFPGFVENFYG